MKLKVMFFKSFNHLLQMVHMISWVLVKNNDVINVAFAMRRMPLQSFKGSWIEFWKVLAKNSISTNNPSHGGSFSKNVILTLSPSLNGN
jgi:hypothetical protein